MGRPRSWSDSAQVEAHRDDLLESYCRVGHSRGWRGVLMGNKPGIFLPTTAVDQDELQKCRAHIAELYGGVVAEHEYLDELEPWLSDAQITALRAGKPVIFTHIPERLIRKNAKAKHTALLSRFRDSGEFAVSQALYNLGLLVKPAEASARTDQAGAVAWICERLSATWWPEGAQVKDKDPYEALLHMHKEGSRTERRARFMDPDQNEGLVREGVAKAHRSEVDRQTEIRFWYSALCAVLKTRYHGAEQKTALYYLSRGIEALMGLLRSEWLTYRGDLRRPVTVDELVALAYFGLHDIERVFPIHASSAPLFRASAELGELARGNPARFDLHCMTTVFQALSKPFEQVGSPTDEPPPLLDAWQFIRHAALRVHDDHWWFSVLCSPVNGDRTWVLNRQGEIESFETHLKRHLERQHVKDAPRFNEVELAFQGTAVFQAFVLFLHNEGYDFRDGSLPNDSLAMIRSIGTDRYALIDICAHRRFEGREPERLLESVIRLVATSTRARLGWGEAQMEDPLVPGYWRESARVISATLRVMSEAPKETLARLEAELQFCKRYLTDAEYDACLDRGEFVGDAIKAFLAQEGVNQDYPFGLSS